MTRRGRPCELRAALPAARTQRATLNPERLVRAKEGASRLRREAPSAFS